MRNASWYPIWPAAPVMPTRTGVLLFCFMDDVCLDNDAVQNEMRAGILACERGPTGYVAAADEHVSRRFRALVSRGRAYAAGCGIGGSSSPRSSPRRSA